MRKWVVLALGAVLALAGLMSIWQGSDIVQIERGWTAVIAGAVTLSGGVVTIAIFFLISAVEDLQASGSLTAATRTDSVREQPAAASTPAPVEETPALSPPAIEAGASASAAAPAMAAIPEPIHLDTPEPAPEPHPVEAEAPPQPPPPFVPPVPPPPVRHEPVLQAPDAPAREPSPARRGFGSLSGSTAAAGLAAGAGGFGLTRGFRFRRPSEAAPPAVPESPPVAPDLSERQPHDADDALRAIEAAMMESAPAHQTAAVEPAPEPEAARIEETESIVTIAESEPATPDQAAAPEAHAEPQDHEPMASAPEEAQRAAAGDLDWLEKALSGEEEPDPALDWLRNRAEAEKAAAETHVEAHPHEPAVAEPAHHEPEPTIAHEEPEPHAQVEPLEEFALHEPDHPAGEPAHADVMHEHHDHEAHAHEDHATHDMHAEHAHDHHHEEQLPLAEATVIGRYSTGGAHYTLYSDGSIDAETPQGTFRFASMADLRAHIEAQNAEG